MKKAILNYASGNVLIIPRDGMVSMLVLEWLAENRIKLFKVSICDEDFHIRMPHVLKETFIELKEYINANIPID